MYPSLWSRALTRTVRLHRSQMSRNQRRALGRVRLALEHLEDRVTPSTTINVNDPSGGMDNPANVSVATLGSKVTLIDAINAANNSGGSDSYVINLPANAILKFTQPLNNTTITSNNVVQDQNWYGPDALPAISSNITIQGNGSTLQIVPNTNHMRFFYVSGGPALTGRALPLGTLELDNLTLEGGVAQGGSGANGGLGAGGAIFNQGNLILNGDTLTDNQAIGGNGGLAGSGGGMSSNGDSSGSGGGFGGSFSIPDAPQGGGGSGGGGGGGAGFQSFDDGESTFDGSGAPGGGQGGFGGDSYGTTATGASLVNHGIGDGGFGGGGSSAESASGGSFGSGGLTSSSGGGGAAASAVVGALAY